MKKIAVVFLLAIGVSSITAWVVKSGNAISEKIIAAFEQGDVAALKPFFDNDLNLVMPDDNVYFELPEIEAQLTAFFNKNTPKKFVVKHKGSSKSKESSYIIGTLITNGADYRISIGLGNDKIKDIAINTDVLLSQNLKL